MLYYSTNDYSTKVDFKEATIKGQAPDKGLFFPEKIPSLSKNFLNNLKSLTKEEIAYEVIYPYTKDVIPENELKKITAETINFDFPLVEISADIFSLELFHGPTLAFKDVGARFMSRCLRYFLRDANKKVTVLVATSGDTGGAVANGFYNVDGVQVIILYPKGKVSSVQELQLTTLGDNVSAINIEGTFDDCQQLVKQAFADKDLNEKRFLTSANSINVARWLPQQFYYFFAYQQWQLDLPLVVCVPSGNFGNICAGLLAHVSGLPIEHFIAACNANNAVCDYLNSGQYQSRLTISTLSNAMDVGNPSNFIRILELFNHQFPLLKEKLSGFSISDEETKITINKVYKEFNYLLDPHGAVGYLALKKYLQSNPLKKGIFLETAHPVKFYDIVEPIIEKLIELPESVKSLLSRKKYSINMKNSYEEFKDILMVDL